VLGVLRVEIVEIVLFVVVGVAIVVTPDVLVVVP
jgi:hypothetical protein